MTIVGARPRAITMWDFSWLERRWPGAGYEDWDRSLAELADRGYDTVRIDAYPHLIDADADADWRLTRLWDQQSWGAQSPVVVAPLPALVDFIRAAGRHGVGVALSTWFRRDEHDVRTRIRTPEDLAKVWVSTLDLLEAAGVLGQVVYVDLCNEFPVSVWAPFLYDSDEAESRPVTDPDVGTWMRTAIGLVRDAHPQLDYTFSFADSVQSLQSVDVAGFDLLEPHLWMAGTSDFYDRVGYAYERTSPVGYDNLVERGREVYRSDQARFDQSIFDEIDRAAEWSRSTGKPLVTTECWSVVDYKDWPGLDWDWVMDLNARAVTRAASTGRWAAIATSNFCGPQFAGVWREVDYHRRLTDLIRSAPIDADLRADA